MHSPDSPLGIKDVSDEVVQIVNGAVKNTAILIDAVRKKGFPIFYLISVYRQAGEDGGQMGERCPTLVNYARRGSKWIDIDKRIPPQKTDTIIEKRVSSGFIGTPLLQLLAFNRVDTCIIAGLSISACVRQNAIDAVSHGYYAVVPEECVGDRGIGPGKASLFDIAAKFADVTSLEDVLGWMNRLE